MNKYKIIGMLAAAVIVVAGCIYLWIGASALLSVLVISAVAVCVMGGANAAEIKASGQGNFISYIPAVCFFVLAAFIVAAIVFYFL